MYIYSIYITHNNNSTNIYLIYIYKFDNTKISIIMKSFYEVSDVFIIIFKIIKKL